MTNPILRCVLVLIAELSSQSNTFAISFHFGTDIGGENNAYVGQPVANIVSEGTTATFTAAPIGTLLDDSDAQGLGIDSRSLSDAIDGTATGDRTKFNLLEGSHNSTSLGESLTFSFNQAGVLNDILFDGVKDETLEYFILTFPNGYQITIFDSQAEYRLDLQGYHLTDLNVPNPIECQFEDDDLTGINYPYLADEVFTLTYGEGNYADVPNYQDQSTFPQFPNALGDGSRLQGIVVTSIPEPTSVLLFLLSCGGLTMWRHPGGSANHSEINSSPFRVHRAK